MWGRRQLQDAVHHLDLLLRPWQGEWVVTYCKVLSWERQDQVWILMRPLCLGDKEGICRAVLFLGQRVWESAPRQQPWGGGQEVELRDSHICIPGELANFSGHASPESAHMLIGNNSKGPHLPAYPVGWGSPLRFRATPSVLSRVECSILDNV